MNLIVCFCTALFDIFYFRVIIAIRIKTVLEPSIIIIKLCFLQGISLYYLKEQSSSLYNINQQKLSRGKREISTFQCWIYCKRTF